MFQLQNNLRCFKGFPECWQQGDSRWLPEYCLKWWLSFKEVMANKQVMTSTQTKIEKDQKKCGQKLISYLFKWQVSLEFLSHFKCWFRMWRRQKTLISTLLTKHLLQSFTYLFKTNCKTQTLVEAYFNSCNQQKHIF